MASRFRNFVGSVGLKLLNLSGFESANPSKSRGWLPGGNPRDAKEEMTSYTRRDLMKKSRYHAKNSGFYREYIADMEMYSVASGIWPRAQTKDPDWNKKAEEYFKTRFGFRADITGRFSFAECESLVCRAVDIDGEVFVVKVKDRFGRPRIQLIESHRCQDDGTLDTVDGIKLDRFGAPAYYMIRHGDGTTFRKIPASAVMHIFEPEYISAVRNAPPQQHSMNNMQDVAELLALEKGAVKSISDIAHILTTEAGEVDENSDYVVKVSDDEDGDGEPTDPGYIEKILGRKTVAVKQGEKLDAHESKRPSPTFTGFLNYLDRESAGGGLPPEMISDPSSIGGAVVRLVTAKAQRRIEKRQQAIINRMVTQCWAYVIGWAIDNGELDPIEGWYKCKSGTPRKLTVDAGRESKENRADVLAGLKSIDDHFDEQGKDAEEELRSRAKTAKLVLDLAEDAGVPPEMIFNFFGGKPGKAELQNKKPEGEEE